MCWLSFTLGVFVGANVGYVILALMIAGRDDDGPDHCVRSDWRSP